MAYPQNEMLTPSQKEAVFHIEGPLLVIAGPGSGKTRVITHRIAALINAGYSPFNICAITFTNKAADEMRQRAIALGAATGVHISTFHSLCVRILRRYAQPKNILKGHSPEFSRSPSRLPETRPNFSIYDESDQRRCMKLAVKGCEIDTKNFPPARMLEAVSTLKNKLIDDEAFKKQADDYFTKTLAKIYSRYQQILKEHNALDFDDLLMQTAFLLENNLQVRKHIGQRFRFLLIDEYQDTNHAQYRIARAMAAEHNNICVTGDPDQSIYRWRGADIRNILAFEKDWPHAAVVKLEQNFRSSPSILRTADSLIACNINRKQKTLVPTISEDRDVEISMLEDELEEAQNTARKIKELTKQGVKRSEIAVFYRINAMSRALEETFINEKIPYQVVRGVEFYNRKEIRDIIAYLKFIANSSDELALLRIINTPSRGIGKTTTDRVRAYAQAEHISFYQALKRAQTIDSLSTAPKKRIAEFVSMMEKFRKCASQPPAAIARRILKESGLEESLNTGNIKDQSALENINELINAAARYEQQTEEPSLIDYLQQIALFSDIDSYDTISERIALMTLHSAKGLEFENVFIIGLEQGLLPHEKSIRGPDLDELEEERRLLFVGLTRAGQGLYLSYVKYRTYRGQLLRTIPSQFLYELGLDLPSAKQISSGSLDYKSNTESEPFGDIDTGNNNSQQFAEGQIVRHNIFGLGRVKEFHDMGENSIVVVRFDSGKTKSLMVKYANLIKL